MPRIAGETRLDGDVSNQLRGGYLEFPLPEIGSWQTIDTMKVLVEFVSDDPRGTGTNSIYLDALWLDVGYERDETVDLSGVPNIATDLATHDQVLRQAEADTLKTKDGVIVLRDISEATDAGLLLKTERQTAIGLRSAEHVVSITNTTDQDLVPSLSLLGLPESFSTLDASFWDTTRSETRTTPILGVTGYYCEGGWKEATSSTVFSCQETGEERYCSARNEDQTNCIVEGDQVGVENIETVVPGWSTLSARSYAEVSALASLLGDYDAKSAIPKDVVGMATIPLDRILAPHQTAYLRIRVTFPENTTGKVSVFAFSDTGASAYGTLGWDALWTKRIPVSVRSDGDTGDLGVVTHIVIDGTQEEFWNEVRPDGGDIRLVDDEAGIEIPFGMTRWDYVSRKAELWGRISTLRPRATSTLYVYFGNPNAERSDDLSAVLATEDPSPRSIVLGNDVGAISVDVTSYGHATRVTVGEGESATIDRGEIYTFERVRSGEIIAATGPIVAAVSGGDATHTVVPLSFSGTRFVVPETGKPRVVFLSAVETPVTLMLLGDTSSVASETAETIDLLPGTPSQSVLLPAGPVTLAGDAPFVVALMHEGVAYAVPLSPLEIGSSVGLMRDRLLLSSTQDGSEYRVTCASGPAEEKDGRRGGETFIARSCVGGMFALSDAYQVTTSLAPFSTLSEETESGVLLSSVPIHHSGVETILPVRTKAVTVACLPGDESSWEIRNVEGDLVRAGNCAPRLTNLEQEVVTPTTPETSFAPGLSLRVVGTTSDPVFVFAQGILPGGEVGVERMTFAGGEVDDGVPARMLPSLSRVPERVFPHDRRTKDSGCRGERNYAHQ